MSTTMNDHIVLITGGNTGIGYETVKALYDSPSAYTILMGSRSVEKAQEAIKTLQSEPESSKSKVVPVQIDIEDDASVQSAFKEVEGNYGRLDTLINNAGASFDQQLKDDPSPTGIRSVWDRDYSLNVTSTQVTTSIFMPLLLKSTHQPLWLLFITFGLSSLTICSSGRVSAAVSRPVPAGWPKPFEQSHIAYRSSKTALNMMMLDWVRLLKDDGVKVFAISPGFLATGLGLGDKEMLKKFGAGDASIGGIFIKDVVEGKRDEDAGQVISKDGLQPW